MDIAWNDGKLANANVTSNVGKNLTRRVSDGAPILVNGDAYVISVSITAGFAHGIVLV